MADDFSAVASDDLREYFISANPEDCALHTIELRHPAFLGDGGANVPLRIVCDHEELTATLEGTAPADAGMAVNFQPLAFEAELPAQGTGDSPSVKLTADNVSAILMPCFEAAANSRYKVELTYRMFLASDLSQPGMILDGLTPKTANATETSASVQAGYEDFYNTPFPPLIYTTTEYPGLDR